MNIADVKRYASVESNGAILLGKHTVCDGMSYGRKIGVFTHIHEDHIRMFNSAMHNCSNIFVSKPTYDMLSALEMNYKHHMDLKLYFKGRHVQALDFNKTLRPKLDRYSNQSGYGDKLTLHQSKHVLGSAQVLVETEDCTRVVYTGDFAAGTEPVPCDVLVLDPTHGNPTFNTKVERNSLVNRLVELVDEALQNHSGVVIHAHRGRLQEMMHFLSGGLSSQVKFLSTQKNIQLAQVYKKYNIPSREIVDVESVEGDIIREGAPYVVFKSGRQQEIKEVDKTVWESEALFSIGGHKLESGTVIKSLRNGDVQVEFMDHADFDYIIDFVQKANPKFVVLDHTRSKQLKELTKHLQDRKISVV